MNNFQVAIDGPAGSGKSTISKKVCEKLGFTHIDTGAMYRAVTLEALDLGIDLEDPNAYSFLNEIAISYENDHIFLNGKSVGREIRSTRVAESVSIVAKMRVVREKMVELQQQAAKNGLILMDGRDIGTVVLPNANLKIFLTASVVERANRRFKEVSEKGTGETYEQILANIEERDYIDSHRDLNPLRKADDAILLDTTNLNIDEVADKIIEEIKRKMN